MQISQEQLNSIAGTSIPSQYLKPINDIIEKYDINTHRRFSNWFGNVCHESTNLRVTQENLNYRADRIRVVFPRYFRGIDTAPYAMNPQKLANRVYANRMGNGNEASGDGYKFRGRGAIQLTGHDNYAIFAKSLNMTIDEVIEYLSTSEGIIESAGWFWNMRKINVPADKNDIRTCRQLVNGGTNGLDDVTKIVNRGLLILK